ncbi:acyl carrier protein [Streptomyces sp. Wb2n-11]|uniref:acyl carrier protein n=1 Tax=Streptomyces sp. Wb2n-11 TaxID=1030533 RepID=UPI000AE639E3|nr:acyl carrier protein [Streptomyces sp. Wb2n-11]
MTDVQPLSSALQPSPAARLSPEDLGEAIKNVLATRIRVAPDRLPDSLTLEDLGLDSLLLAESLVALETRFGVVIDPLRFAERLTPGLPLGELVAELAGHIGAAR